MYVLYTLYIICTLNSGFTCRTLYVHVIKTLYCLLLARDLTFAKKIAFNPLTNIVVSHSQFTRTTISCMMIILQEGVLKLLYFKFKKLRPRIYIYIYIFDVFAKTTIQITSNNLQSVQREEVHIGLNVLKDNV
jgi:hypothetical protein